MTEEPASFSLLQERLRGRWRERSRGGRRWLVPEAPLAPSRPRRRLTHREACEVLERAFLAASIRHRPALPIAGLPGSSVTFSPAQLINDGRGGIKAAIPHSAWGLYIQPVVREKSGYEMNARRSTLTAFHNVATLAAVASLGEHVALVDRWITALSSIGLHARRMTFRKHGADRRPGCWCDSFHVFVDGVEIGDATLMHVERGAVGLISDIGFGLERIRWCVNREPWRQTAFDAWGPACSLATLDAVWAATLLVSQGVLPSANGPGQVVRHLLRRIPDRHARTGLSALIRLAHAHWDLSLRAVLPWGVVCERLERARSAHGVEIASSSSR